MAQRIALRDICKIYDGPHATPTKTVDGPIYLGIDAITEDGKLDSSQFAHLSETDYLKWTKRVTPQHGDIVFSYEATLGRYALIPEGFYGCLGRRLAIIRNTSPDIDTTWLYYYFRSPEWTNFIQSKIVKGSTVNRLSIEDFPSYTIPKVPIETQKRIARILSSIDKKIYDNDAVNDNLQQMAKTIYDYWFTQFDFPNKDGRPYRSSGGAMVWDDKLKKEIPQGWTSGQLSDIANITMGQSPEGSTYNEQQIGTVFFQGCTDFGTRFPEPRVYTTAPTRFAKAGDILMSVRAPVGTLNVALEDCCIGRGLAALNSKYGSQLHLMYTLVMFKHHFDIMDSNGTTFGSITKDELYEMKVVIPPAEQMKAFEKMVQPIEQKIKQCELENRVLIKQRNWLLPMLMNGQATVEG